MSENIRKIKLEASSVEDAVRMVASELGVSESRLQATIVSEEKRFLGLFGKKLSLEITVSPEDGAAGAGINEKSEKSEKNEKSAKAERSVTRTAERKPERKVSEMAEDEPREPADMSEESRVLMSESKVFVEKLVEMMELSVTPQISGNFISIEGADAAIIVGRYGDTLKAIEYILNLCLRDTKDIPRVRLDSDGYRDRRAANLQRLAVSAARKATERGAPIRLEPMVSWERRIVHLALQDSPDVVTESIGESPDRKVVIMPKVDHNETRARPRRRARRPF